MPDVAYLFLVADRIYRWGIADVLAGDPLYDNRVLLRIRPESVGGRRGEERPAVWWVRTGGRFWEAEASRNDRQVSGKRRAPMRVLIYSQEEAREIARKVRGRP